MSESEIVRVHAFVNGRVQGVFYRASTVEEARAHRLCGWVRNLTDGRVEFVAEGLRENVEALVRWSQSGPPMARVDAVDVRWENVRGDEEEFRVR